MSYPDRLLGAQMIQELDQVSDDLFLAVGLMPVINAGPPITAHVRRYGAKPQPGQYRQLMTPRDRKLWPAMHEYDRRRVGSAAGEVETRVSRTLGNVLFDSMGHRCGSFVQATLARPFPNRKGETISFLA